MYLRAERSAADAPSPSLVIHWVDPWLPHVWQLGYEDHGEFHPWAGGSSEEALHQLIARERVRKPHTLVYDRRRHGLRKPLPV